MIRRRRPVREIPFNLDCFLDVITNVVGIIVRLILITWVGGRAYHAVMEALPAAAPKRRRWWTTRTRCGKRCPGNSRN